MEKLIRRLASALVVVMALGWGGIAAGLRYNGSHSLPVGLYLATGKVAHRGALVLVNLPSLPIFELAKERGYLNVAFSPVHWIMKRIAAVEGDRVTISAAGVDVNGIRLANSAPMNRDGAGRPLVPYPLKDHYLLPGEVLLMSEYNPASFDSRYFGPLQVGAIESVVTPLLTF